MKEKVAIWRSNRVNCQSIFFGRRFRLRSLLWFPLLDPLLAFDHDPHASRVPAGRCRSSRWAIATFVQRSNGRISSSQCQSAELPGRNQDDRWRKPTRSRNHRSSTSEIRHHLGTSPDPTAGELPRAKSNADRSSCRTLQVEITRSSIDHRTGRTETTDQLRGTEWEGPAQASQHPAEARTAGAERISTTECPDRRSDQSGGEREAVAPASDGQSRSFATAVGASLRGTVENGSNDLVLFFRSSLTF